MRTSGRRSQPLVLQVDSPPRVRVSADHPDFGALGLSAANFAMTDENVHIELVGDFSTAVFDGRLQHGEISGTGRKTIDPETSTCWEGRAE